MTDKRAPVALLKITVFDANILGHRNKVSDVFCFVRYATESKPSELLVVPSSPCYLGSYVNFVLYDEPVGEIFVEIVQAPTTLIDLGAPHHLHTVLGRVVIPLTGTDYVHGSLSFGSCRYYRWRGVDASSPLLPPSSSSSTASSTTTAATTPLMASASVLHAPFSSAQGCASTGSLAESAPRAIPSRQHSEVLGGTAGSPLARGGEGFSPGMAGSPSAGGSFLHSHHSQNSSAHRFRGELRVGVKLVKCRRSYVSTGRWEGPTSGGDLEHTGWVHSPQYMLVVGARCITTLLLDSDLRRRRRPICLYVLRLSTGERGALRTPLNEDDLRCSVDAHHCWRMQQATTPLSVEVDLSAGAYVLLPCVGQPGDVGDYRLEVLVDQDIPVGLERLGGGDAEQAERQPQQQEVPQIDERHPLRSMHRQASGKPLGMEESRLDECCWPAENGARTYATLALRPTAAKIALPTASEVAAYSPMMRAAVEGDVEMLRRLVSEDDSTLDGKERTNRDAGNAATQLPMSDSPLSELDAAGRNLLMVSVCFAQLEVTRLLLAAGVDPFQLDHLGCSCVSYAALVGAKECFDAIHTHCKEAQQRGDMDKSAFAKLCAMASSDESELTPFLLAVHAGHRSLCSALLRAGANAKITDRRKETALYKSTLAGDLPFSRLLVENRLVRRTRNLFAPPTRSSYLWECAGLELTNDHAAGGDGSTQLRVLEVYVSLGTTGLGLLQVCILNSRIVSVSLVLGADVDLNDPRATSSFELRRDQVAASKPAAADSDDGETERLIVEAVAEGALEILRVLAQRGDLSEYASMCKLIGVSPMSYDQVPMHEFLSLFLAQEHRHSMESVSSSRSHSSTASRHSSGAGERENDEDDEDGEDNVPKDSTPIRRRHAGVHSAADAEHNHNSKNGTVEDRKTSAAEAVEQERALHAKAISSSNLGLIRLALLSDASGLSHLLAGVGSVQLTRVMTHLQPAQLITVRPMLLSSMSLRVRKTRADLGVARLSPALELLSKKLRRKTKRKKRKEPKEKPPKGIVK